MQIEGKEYTLQDLDDLGLESWAHFPVGSTKCTEFWICKKGSDEHDLQPLHKIVLL